MIKKRKPTKSKVASKVSTQTKVSLVVAMALAAFIGYSFALSMFSNFDKKSNLNIQPVEDTVNGEEWNRCHVDINNQNTLFCNRYNFTFDRWEAGSYDCGGQWISDESGNWSCI